MSYLNHFLDMRMIVNSKIPLLNTKIFIQAILFSSDEIRLNPAFYLGFQVSFVVLNTKSRPFTVKQTINNDTTYLISV